MLLLRQGEQAWLLTGGSGKHEFARAYFCSPKAGDAPRYIVRDGGPRLANGIELVHVAVTADGADFAWSSGHVSHVPGDYFQWSALF